MDDRRLSYGSAFERVEVAYILCLFDVYFQFFSLDDPHSDIHYNMYPMYSQSPSYQQLACLSSVLAPQSHSPHLSVSASGVEQSEISNVYASTIMSVEATLPDNILEEYWEEKKFGSASTISLENSSGNATNNLLNSSSSTTTDKNTSLSMPMSATTTLVDSRPQVSATNLANLVPLVVSTLIKGLIIIKFLKVPSMLKSCRSEFSSAESSYHLRRSITDLDTNTVVVEEEKTHEDYTLHNCLSNGGGGGGGGASSMLMSSSSSVASPAIVDSKKRSFDGNSMGGCNFMILTTSPKRLKL